TICRLQRRQFDEALAALAQLRLKTPDNFDAVHLTSVIQVEKGDLAEGLKTLEAHPFATADYFASLAEAYIRNDEFPKAAEAAREALSIEESIEGKMTLANALGFPVVSKRTAGGLESQTLTDAELSDVHEAIRVAESAITVLKAQDRKFQTAEALT